MTRPNVLLIYSEQGRDLFLGATYSWAATATSYS